MFSFYGGQQGKNFEIKQIFKNKVAMVADLDKRWQSPIGVGEIVMISYGLPGGTPEQRAIYDANKDVDTAKYKRAYNSTLWQKIFTEEEHAGEEPIRGIEILYLSDKNYGLGYKLITSLTGETPRIKIILPSTVLNADQEPTVDVDNNDTDFPSVLFSLPQSQVMVMADLITKKPGETVIPTLNYNEDDINHPIITFTLPEMWEFEIGNIEYISADSEPRATITLDEDNQTKKLNMWLPKGYDFAPIDFSTLEPGQTPECSLTYDNDHIVTIHLKIPRSQKFRTDVITNHLAPAELPTVEISADPDNPQFTFNLPEAAEFFYGDLLGQSKDITYSLGTIVPNAKVGDYYINKDTGFIYYISQITETSTTFVYCACLAGKIPEVQTDIKDPFTETGERVDVTVESSYKDPIEKTGPIHKFIFPTIPNITSTYEDVGSADEGTVEKSIVGTDTINFKFILPSGARWFVGDEVNDNKLNVIIEGAQNGDYYLYSVDDMTDDFRGNIYLFNGTSWTKTNKNIEGPVGKALNIKNSYTFTEADGVDTLENIGNKLKVYYPNGISSDEILQVTYSSVENGDTAYWYYYANNAWGRAQLTGGVASLLQDKYDTDNSTNKTYTANYINNLIVNEILAADLERKTYTAKAINKKNEELQTKINEVAALISDEPADKTKGTYTAKVIDNLITTVGNRINSNPVDKDKETYNAKTLDTKLEEIITQINSINTWGRISDLLS